MSRDGKDSEKSFLSRWSQRKQEAKQPEADLAAAEPAEDLGGLVPSSAEDDTDDQFDLSSLPKLEEITETTDITGFLRKGVPESLRNAALRKSWALDPAIRNYVNPALDYAYDWNTPGGVPGASELEVGTDIAKMVRQIMGGDSADQGPSIAASPRDVADPASDGANVDASQNPSPALERQSVRLSMPSASLSTDNEPAEQAENPQQMEEDQAAASQQKVRRHGTAKPRV